MRILTRTLAACAAALGVTTLFTTPARSDVPPKAVTDAEFVTQAASGGMFEVLSSKMATEKATKAECKAFAEKMIADHTKANDALKAAASKAGIPVPETLSPQHEKTLASLKDARNFDAAYVNAQVKAHADAVELFTAASNSVKDAGLREHAAKTLPVLKMHYEHIKKHAAAGSGTGTR